MLGWTPEELRSRPLIDFVHPDDRVRAGREIEQMFSGVIDGCTNRLATRAGGWRDVEWTARVVAEDERIYAVARDVTERNRMEGALEASEARYRTLVHNLPNSSVVTYDHDLRYTFAAGDALATAGLSPDILGRTLSEVLPQHAATLVAALSRRARRPLTGVRVLRRHRPVLGPDRTAARRRRRDRGRHAAHPGHHRHQAGGARAGPGRRAVPDRVRGGADRHGPRRPAEAATCASTRRCARSPATAEEQLLGMHADGDHASRRRRRPTPRRIEPLLDGARRSTRTEKRYMHADGHIVLGIGARATLVRDARRRPQHILGQIQDITERRRFEDQLQHLADHDPLTGLFNRRRFEQELDRHVAHAPRYGAERRAARARPRQLQVRQRHARPQRRATS